MGFLAHGMDLPWTVHWQASRVQACKVIQCLELSIILTTHGGRTQPQALESRQARDLKDCFQADDQTHASRGETVIIFGHLCGDSSGLKKESI